MPETPRFLIAIKDYDAARKVFSKIAKFNGVRGSNPENFIFDVEEKKDLNEV